MLRQLLTAGFLVGLAATSNSSSSIDATPSERLLFGSTPCDALAAAGLGDRLLLPTDSGYEPQIQTWWAANTRLRPWCLVLPHDAAEVSLALTTLVDAGHGAGDWHIAVRSGGHGPTGSSNIANGVTIDLSMMNSSHYDESTKTARIEPGARWENAFASLQEQGFTVAGGRDGDVGVGGFLLGGGLSFFLGKVGFGCDTVINYEVVLTNGTIVAANETNNSDLWRALKGGGSNFGIVTRFDLEPIPTRDLLHDLRFLPANYSSVVLDAVVDFSNHDESLGENSLVAFFRHDTSISRDITIGTIYVNALGEPDAKTSFDNIRNLPAIYNATSLKTMAKAAADSKVASGMMGAGSTLLVKNNPAIVRYAAELHEQMVKSLKESLGADNFTTMMFFQPLPSYVGKIGQQRGGNMLGLQDMEDGAVLWTGGVTVSTEASLAVVQALLNAMSAQISDFAKSVNGDLDFVYLNYADLSQDPLGSYGAEQVQYLRDVAARYDPTGVFQSCIPGGFKIGRVA